MGNLKYHKGSFCIYTSVFCQEGDCTGCEIYLRRPCAAEKTGRPEGLRNIRKMGAVGMQMAGIRES
jgi:hypothetical protein